MSATSNQPTAVVVDGYGAGNFFPAVLTSMGARPLHVQGTPELLPTMTPPNLADYVGNIVCTDEQSLVEEVRGHAPVCVIPGQESAVLLTDRLGEALGLPSNGTALSLARRDKYEMIEALRRAGLHCARQFKAPDPDAAVAWAEQGGSYPVVAKPVSSAGTDGVFICTDAGQVRSAVEQILASSDIFGGENRVALMQSYLAGTEYIVDTVSCGGEHFFCGVWQYEKTLLPTGRRIYDKDILVDPDSHPVPELISYVSGVLRALGIEWGAAHSEVIMTADGPALVEIGARLNGNINPGFHDVCTGTNQVTLTTMAYLRPEEFRATYAGGVYRKLRSGVVYNVSTTLQGTVESVDEAVVDNIRALESVHLVSVKLKPGARLVPTTTLLNSPIRVYLAASSDEQLESDYQEIRRLKDSVYRLR